MNSLQPRHEPLLSHSLKTKKNNTLVRESSHINVKKNNSWEEVMKSVRIV